VQNKANWGRFQVRSLKCQAERRPGDLAGCTNEPNLSIADWRLRMGHSLAAGRPLRSAASGLREPIVRNKPNSRRARHPHHSSIPCPMPAVQTNPISTIMPIRRSALPGGQACETNPIVRQIPQCSTIPSFQYSNPSRLCQTKPIAPER
jgi:hypothetical protein